MNLDQLVQQPESHRDAQWEKDFLKNMATASVEVVHEEPRPGPEGWPYLLVKTGGQEPFRRVMEWMLTRGVGCAVNTHKMMPDYVFTYGMIWNFAQTGQFVADGPMPEPKQVEISLKTRPLMGEPSEAYLPGYVRKVLRQFLAAQGLNQVRVLAASSNDYKDVDLVISQESLGGLPPKEHKVLAEALSWFLPLHYTLVFASEKDLRGFVNL